MTDHNQFEVSHLRLALGERELIRDLSFEISGGDVLTLMGPSGCGKSSLLSHICGTLEPAFEVSGQIVLNGRALNDYPAEARRVGILFQDDLLFPHMTVAENLAFGLPAQVRPRQARKEKVEAALKDADLEGFGYRDPKTLSGGQRARVALLRVLLSDPELLLLDEPFSKLDTALREQVRRFVFSHARALNLPVLMVTHDPEDARAAQGQILTL
ncbi:ATP-binding cassette domain-containing protein [Rhodovibrionaceae bacterium A322]